MNKERQRYIFELIGLLSIVGSLILVVLEIGQNNQLMEAEARLNRLNAGTRNVQTLLDNSPVNVLELLLKSPDELNQEERGLVGAFYFIGFSTSNWTFLELPRSELPASYWRTSYSSPHAQRTWSTQKTFFDSGFVEYIETNILPHLTPELNLGN